MVLLEMLKLARDTNHGRKVMSAEENGREPQGGEAGNSENSRPEHALPVETMPLHSLPREALAELGLTRDQIATPITPAAPLAAPERPAEFSTPATPAGPANPVGQALPVTPATPARSSSRTENAALTPLPPASPPASVSVSVTKRTGEITPLPSELISASSSQSEISRNTMMAAEGDLDFLREMAEAEQRAALAAESPLPAAVASPLPVDSGEHKPSRAPVTPEYVAAPENPVHVTVQGDPTGSEAADCAPATMMQLNVKRPTPLRDQLGRQVEAQDLEMATSQFSDGVPEWFLHEGEEIERHRGKLDVSERLTEEGDEEKRGLTPWLLFATLIGLAVFLYQYLTQA